MDPDQKYTREVLFILKKLEAAKFYLGEYMSHKETIDGDVIVTLASGTVLLYKSEVRAANILSDKRFPDIKDRYRPLRR